ncbi:MAG: ShlB/FhaC/HecB family hemolysin secretion/activation protein [Gammaproteobacteria bacterium]|nr:ShlB/FhaC/HecB family hemolysin secretion/activation protein [Gammaproteobacteria bacterium]MBU1491785.1 ShlB/FhaC/HecB family hemolysin secretion/activation protein [Gammaproteobacteria bacterium]MBU2064515.1 ShlB/FhaC/HecB family hemolysin secretion/activation protein [Gammaproteobacteria bacterium]MBU2138702.1 ShlB/FhaC/HecB family hemolysin secretion/activation protein [Gammaproteobacteria bacterium]MBU2214921.1 ShlB/FhaC/HecB family hemolysin secretion/activation protein [Gammaproteobac
MHIRFCPLAIWLLLTPAIALAQTPGDRELIRDRQERLLQEQQRRLDELRQLPGEMPQLESAPAQDERCFEIEQIRLEGATLLSEADQARILQAFAGQCLGVSQLNELLKAITQFYIDRGYVTSRAYLPQQELASGVLRVIVVEGRLEGLDSSELASERELAMGFPGQVDEVLDLRELEQLVDQLNRLPSRQAQLELVPGEAVGGSRVRLAGARDKPWRVSLNRHNDGQASSGEQQWGAGLDWDSPLGLADQVSLRGAGDTLSDHWRHSASQSLYYNLPYGWWTFNYSYSQSYYRSLAEANGFDFHTDGESRSHTLRAERVVHRDSVGKTAFNVGLSHLRTRNYIENSLLDASSNRLSEFQLGFNHGRRIGTAFVNLDLGWQRGTGAFDAQDNNYPQSGEPVARYNKYSLTLSYLQPFQLGGESFSVDSLATGQKSEDLLFSPQRISVGGLNSVRGFKEQSLTGDSGGYWRNQLRWRRPVTVDALRPWLGEYGVTLAYDVGVIKGDRYNSGMSGRLSGQAIELYLRGQHLSTSVTWAQSLERPDAIAEAEHPLYFRVDLYF